MIHKTENQKCRTVTDIQLANWVCHSPGYSLRVGLPSWPASNNSAVIDAHVFDCHESYTWCSGEVTCKHLPVTELSHCWQIVKRITIQPCSILSRIECNYCMTIFPKYTEKNYTEGEINKGFFFFSLVYFHYISMNKSHG